MIPLASGCARLPVRVFNVLDFSLIDGGSSFHVDDGSWVVTESDLGCHRHGTAWFVCDVASPVSLEGSSGGEGVSTRTLCHRFI